MTIRTVVHLYDFNIKKPEEKERWEALRNHLNDMVGEDKCFCASGMETQRTPFPFRDGDAVTLDTRTVFNNQWNTAPGCGTAAGYRLFDWYLNATHIQRQPDRRSGHYLVQLPEMAELRDTRLSCRYCGKQYETVTQTQCCDHCLGSKYLKEEDLPLLYLRPVSKGSARRTQVPEDVWEGLYQRFIEVQTTARIGDLERAREKALKRHREAVESANNDLEGRLWLLDHDIPVDQLVYYDHRKSFCIGYSSGLDPAVAEALEEKAKGFPFPLEIRRKS